MTKNMPGLSNAILGLLLLANASAAEEFPNLHETLVRELREHPTWVAADQCPDATIFLDETFGAGFTLRSFNQLMAVLRERKCRLAELPRGSWAGFDDSLLFRALSGRSDKWIALSVQLTGQGPEEMVAAIRWSAGGYGQQHRLYFERQGDAWVRTKGKDEHLIIVKKW